MMCPFFNKKLTKTPWVWFFCLVMIQIAPAQSVNPPYPRFGIFTFSGLSYASTDILKDFDVIAIIPNNEMARRYKQQNPNVVLLAVNTWLVYDRERGQYNFPEAWYYHDKDGNRFQVWNGCWMMNFTSYCPVLDLNDGQGPISYVDWVMHWTQDHVDFTYYDGLFHDWWWPSPGYPQRAIGDFNSNHIADMEEWGGPDSVDAVWFRGLINYHAKEYAIPGVKYVVVQIGNSRIWPYVNGSCFEDWPMYNGPWTYWRDMYNDTKTTTKSPRIMLFNSSHRHFYKYFPVEPYKNNYRSVRFGLASCLLTSAFFYVDEGNDLGHHGNVHIYDEFEAKGALGYPRSDMIKLPGKPLASTPYASGVWVRFFDHGVSIVNATGRTQTITASELSVLDPVPGSRYYRFQGGQDPEFNNGQEVTDANPLVLWGDTHLANWLEPEVFGDGAMLFRTRKVLVTPIIVDNHVNNQTSPGSDPIEYIGNWVLSSEGEYYYAFYTGRNYAVFQPDGFAWSAPGQGENIARYVPTIGVPGLYEVFEWHGYRGSSPQSFPLSSSVPVRITHASGDTLLTIDQTKNFGKWNSLGTYYFAKGKSGKVEISNNTTGIVIADAIRFVYKGTPGVWDLTPPAPPQNVKVTRPN